MASVALAPCAVAQELSVGLEQVVGGLTEPIGIEHAGDGSGRLFVIEQAGRIRILQNGSLFSTSFLDISARVTPGGEQGLLGLAFHPDYPTNGVFFIHYIDVNGDTVIERCNVSAEDPSVADDASCDIIFALAQPASNHNGGKLAFGPDGYLYVSLGDGGGGGDPDENAQDTSNLYGTLLRLDVDGDDFPGDPNRDYAIPADNPFVGLTGEDEIWVYGLRNPWRFSFDRVTGGLWIGDVGQAKWEEIDFEPAGDPGGRNYGWDVLEGAHCFEDEPAGSCSDFLAGGSTLPRFEYSSDGTGHCSVTGGFVYRGTAQPQLYDVYVFGDFCSGAIWGSLPKCSGSPEFRELADTSIRVSTFGEDEAGELYVAEFSRTAGAGAIHRVVVSSGGPAINPSPATLDYGTRSAGDTVTLETLLTHTGSGADAVIIDVFGLSDAHHFSVDASGGSDPCGAPPVCLAPGEDCSVSVTFAPQREGAFDEFLTMLANSPPAPVSLQAEVPCTGPDNLALNNQNVSSDTFFTGCLSVTTGPSFTVEFGVFAELRAGQTVSMGPGTAVAAGASLAVAIDPFLAQ